MLESVCHYVRETDRRERRERRVVSRARILFWALALETEERGEREREKELSVEPDMNQQISHHSH